MANFDYPPWSTAPSRMEREKASSKWSNAKDALLKPWRRRSQRRAKSEKPSPRTNLAETPPLYNNQVRINPFASPSPPNPFAMGVFPGGFPFHRSPNDMFKERSPTREAFSDISPVTRPREDTPKGIFEPPDYKVTRPPLSNIFSMFEQPRSDKEDRKSDKKSDSTVTPVSSKNRLSSSENTSSSNLPYKRRHSTPSVPIIYQPPPRPMRSSNQSSSSDIPTERRNRRDRRTAGVRILPSVPSRDSEPTQSMLEGKNQQYSPKPPKMQRIGPNSFSSTPDASKGGLSSSYPHWSSQPRQQLLELEEELEEVAEEEEVEEAREKEEVDGFENSMNFYHHPPPPSVPVVEDVRGGRGGGRERKKKKEKNGKKNMDMQKKPPVVGSTAYDDEEIKGFDGFMMY